MKVNTKNCLTENLYSYGTDAFIVITVKLEYHIPIDVKFNS